MKPSAKLINIENKFGEEKMGDGRTMVERGIYALKLADTHTMAKGDEWCEIIVRAIIKEMRQPTEEMDKAGLDDPHGDYCDRCMQSGHSRNSGWPTIVWQAMIDEALGEER